MTNLRRWMERDRSEGDGRSWSKDRTQRADVKEDAWEDYGDKYRLSKNTHLSSCATQGSPVSLNLSALSPLESMKCAPSDAFLLEGDHVLQNFVWKSDPLQRSAAEVEELDRTFGKLRPTWVLLSQADDVHIGTCPYDHSESSLFFFREISALLSLFEIRCILSGSQVKEIRQTDRHVKLPVPSCAVPNFYRWWLHDPVTSNLLDLSCPALDSDRPSVEPDPGCRQSRWDVGKSAGEHKRTLWVTQLYHSALSSIFHSRSKI